MTKQTIQNILDEIILKKLEDDYYLKSSEIVDEFEQYCDNEEDLDEITDLIFNSKKYNYILLQNGEGFILSKDKGSFECFFELEDILDRDEVWNEYFYYNNSSEKLINIYQDIKEEE